MIRLRMKLCMLFIFSIQIFRVNTACLNTILIQKLCQKLDTATNRP